MEQDTTLLLQAVDAIHDTASLDEALVALVAVLQPRFELWYASFATIPSGSQQVHVLASWSLTETVFDVGTEISLKISSDAEGAIEVLRQGRPRLTETSDGSSLIESLLTQQGVASLATLPVHCDDGSLLLLTLGSSSQNAFHSAITGFFEGLAAGIKQKVLRLANSPTA